MNTAKKLINSAIYSNWKLKIGWAFIIQLLLKIIGILLILIVFKVVPFTDGGFGGLAQGLLIVMIIFTLLSPSMFIYVINLWILNSSVINNFFEPPLFSPYLTEVHFIIYFIFDTSIVFLLLALIQKIKAKK
ncbi:hypothetical protein A2957_01320 [Candidatus Roizmanbacteria bacterium RIFCSPLOWO2_01_FULL_38_11]|uniref:Uncharacterized protein n=1 Tax=Candidatus Roizmanbacteria bacterium RIFCSPLOWO2_01_FULL_38_11 TaxID=1802060 RepID=A0A1F7IL65_9BACT|nr:MAG: hypothetical protein A2957_01320 [Candidatus Roizmanbacteria bacterium RIFCSPLOWO2_01_FULL_38_11]